MSYKERSFVFLCIDSSSVVGSITLIVASENKMSSSEDEGYSNPWNQYQHDHAGQGWSRSDMSENYQQYKASGNQSSSNDDERETYNNSYSYGHDRVKESSSDDEKTYSNAWNKYQHDHTGQDWSKSMMSREYQNDQVNGNASFFPSESFRFEFVLP